MQVGGDKAAKGHIKGDRDKFLKKQGTWFTLFPGSNCIEQRYFSVPP